VYQARESALFVSKTFRMRMVEVFINFQTKS
jgi:hypothetical protein